MKKKRQGSKIVDIVQQKFKILDKVIPKRKQTTRTRKASPVRKRPAQSTTDYINEEKVLVVSPGHEVTYDEPIFQRPSSSSSSSSSSLSSSSSSSSSTSVQASKQSSDDSTKPTCIRPDSSSTLLNDDLYLTDSTDEYMPQDDETSSSTSDDSVKPTRKSTTNIKTTRNGTRRRPIVLPPPGIGKLRQRKPATLSTDKAPANSDASGSQNRLRKKRQARPYLWKKNIRKNNRQLGQPYVSATGVLMPGKTLKESKCMGRCLHLCTSKFSEEDRLKIFSTFWNIGSVEQKRLYIMNLIQREHPTRIYKTKHARKKYFNNYFLRKVGSTEKIRVCQKFFVATLSVSDTFVRFCFKKVFDSRVVVGDNRGKHTPHNKKPKEVRQHVRNHIKSFPRMPVPRGHRGAKKEYLPRTLNLTKMYNMYRLKCEREQRDPVDLAYYRSVFNKDFNIGFHKRGRDVCETCSNYEKMDDEQKEELTAELEEHFERIDAANQHNNEAKRLAKRGEIHFAEYDLKSIRDCSRSPTKRKLDLPVYNFTVLNYKEDHLHVLCYCWHDGIAKKGATEIGSCLYKYIESNADGRPITFMSDTSASQCRNMYISSLLLYCIEIFDIPEINQKYFENGHSQMETDDIHANIERAKKYVAVRDPHSFYNLIRTSLSKYINNVHEMEQDDFIDLKYLKNLLVKNAKIDSKGESVHWSNIRWLQYRKKNPHYIYFKYDLGDKNFKKIEVFRRREREQDCKNIVLLKKIHDGPYFSQHY